MLEQIKGKVYNRLRWSEKYTKTDMVYLTKGSFWLSVGNIASMASAFLLSIAFANLLPPETYGTYKYILSIVGIISIPTLYGMTTAITQAVARGNEGTLMPATNTRIRWGLLSGLASLVAAGYYYYGHNYTLTICFLITACFLPFMDTLNTYFSFLAGKKLFRDQTALKIISQILIVATTILNLYLTKNLLLVIFVYFSSRTVINFVLYKFTIKKYRPNQLVDAKAISYGKHLTLIGVLGLIAGQLDKILIWHYLGAIELAVYSFALAPVDQANSAIFNNINTLAMPKLSENDPKTIRDTLPGKIMKILPLTIIMALVYIAAAPFLYKLIYPQYIGAAVYSRFYAFSLAILPLSTFNTALAAQAQKKKLYFLSFTVSGFKILLLTLLLPPYGIAGAITSILATQAYSNIAQYYLFKRM